MLYSELSDASVVSESFSVYTVCNREVDKDGETRQRAERRNCYQNFKPKSFERSPLCLLVLNWKED